MKNFLLAIAAFACSCAPASALTNVSSCQSLSGGDQYVLTQNISTAAAVCLEVTGQSGGVGLDIDCNGYSVTSTHTSGRPYYVHDNSNAIIWLHGCEFISSTSSGYGKSSSAGSLVDNNYGNDTGRNGIAASVWSTGNTYRNGSLTVKDSNYFTSIYDTHIDSYLFCWSSDYCLVDHDSVNVSANHGSNAQYDSGFVFFMSNNGQITNSSVTGYPGTQANGANIDSGIQFWCDGDAVTAPTTTCGYAIADNITTTDTYQHGIEFVGRWSGVHVLNSYFVRPQVTGIACHGYWACSMDNGWFYNNSVTRASYATSIISMTAHPTFGGSGYGGFFSNNAIQYNTIDTGAGGTNHLGVSTDAWGYQYNNTILGNQFGGGYVSVQGTTGFTDSGGNYCSGSSAVITCL